MGTAVHLVLHRVERHRRDGGGERGERAERQRRGGRGGKRGGERLAAARRRGGVRGGGRANRPRTTGDALTCRHLRASDDETPVRGA